MKFVYFLSLVTFPFFACAQNVGIGTPIPSEKLDVNGNINLTGALKASGNAGSKGQVLMSTGTGISWGSTAGYRKCVIFLNSSGTWTVPAGVTEVMAELWGGGSGGTQACGGTSGGYARTVQTVTPGYGIAWSVGAGTTYGINTTNTAGSSQCTFPLGYIQANGGGGIALSGTHGPVSSGTGTLTNNYFYMFGNAGQFNHSSFGLKNATTYVEIVEFGAGGAPVGMLNPTALEGDLVRYENGTSVSAYNGTGSVVPSAGGAAGLGSGWSGANGMIIFWYND